MSKPEQQLTTERKSLVQESEMQSTHQENWHLMLEDAEMQDVDRDSNWFSGLGTTEITTATIVDLLPEYILTNVMMLPKKEIGQMVTFRDVFSLREGFVTANQPQGHEPPNWTNGAPAHFVQQYIGSGNDGWLEAVMPTIYKECGIKGKIDMESNVYSAIKAYIYRQIRVGVCTKYADVAYDFLVNELHKKDDIVTELAICLKKD